MLHFPSPVKLTGWNTTGGLLGDEGWEAFFYFIFFYSPPPASPMIPFPCYQFLSLCALIMSPVCFCGPGLLAKAARSSDVLTCCFSSAALITPMSSLQDPTWAVFIIKWLALTISCHVVLTWYVVSSIYFFSAVRQFTASYLLSGRVAFLIFFSSFPLSLFVPIILSPQDAVLLLFIQEKLHWRPRMHCTT